MVLYHGSSVPGIKELRPISYGEGDALTYLTHSRVLAAIYAHNPMTRPNGYFTYWFDRDGRLYYDEYFENQTEILYSGQRGFVYECDGEFPQMEKMPWVYLSKTPVPVKKCEEIPDIYKQLLSYEVEGSLTIRRWSDASQGQRDIWEGVVRRSLAATDLATPLGREYFDFIRTYFGAIE